MNVIEKRGPFRVTKRETKYKNPWIEVTEDSILNEDNKKGIMGIVKIKHGVAILPMDEDNNVYLVNVYKYSQNKFFLETCGGGIEKNQTPLQAAKQELKEELGLTATKWKELGYFHPITSIVDTKVTLFFAKGLKEVEMKHEAFEKIEKIKLPFKEFIKKIENNEIKSSYTIILGLKVKELLKKK